MRSGLKIKSVMTLAAATALLAGGAMAQSGAQSGDWRTVSPENLWVIDTAKGRVLVEAHLLSAGTPDKCDAYAAPATM